MKLIRFASFIHTLALLGSLGSEGLLFARSGFCGWINSCILMQSHPEIALLGVKQEENGFTDTTAGHMGGSFQRPVEVSSSLEDDRSLETGDEDTVSNENNSKQLVLYDPGANGEIEPVPDPIRCSPLPLTGDLAPPSRILPSVGAFTVQCANCLKWRLIPTKEKYEEIREHILEQPFVCEAAREWRPDIQCDDPTDISQDDGGLWAIDKPNIAQPPPGWQRLLRIRGEGSTKFADVYYVSPSGKKLRSTVEIQRYLMEHPEYMTDGVTLSRFSFQTPKPLQENYVRKRTTRVAASYDSTSLLESGEVSPLAWASPDGFDLQHGTPALPPPPYYKAPFFDPVGQPFKKRRRTPSRQLMNRDTISPNPRDRRSWPF
ncbi:methyl-CpG-binding domain-containing protein 2-like isoform X2 [Tripterygium wilfordii]|uniref:methyl-CpG-binding domain-containing protein 2-like isoform X2 n=1 Tax=Tripterygium wilfordii TaxID=458696 RepID=UPI0018F862AA|nr:methyl-CpG-binding domain-containing protein 2-like isoform X2 [Tripterygium wilfordii]